MSRWPFEPPTSFDDFEEHPLYGRGPRYTELAEPTRLHYRISRKQNLRDYVQGTLVEADLKRQTFSQVPVTHYADELRVCRMCGVKFIFFAEEQKYWYEELGFTLDANAVDCVACRKEDQGLNRLQRQVEALMLKQSLTDDEIFDLGEITIRLIDAGISGQPSAERVRSLLNKLPAHLQHTERCVVIRAGLKGALEHRASNKAEWYPRWMAKG